MDPAGNYDPRHGIREFIIGTGGESLDTGSPRNASNPDGTPNLQAWADQYYGVMKFRLYPDGYSWDYESALESPTRAGGHAADLQRQGHRLLQPRGLGLLRRGCLCGVGMTPAPRAYSPDGKRGGAAR